MSICGYNFPLSNNSFLLIPPIPIISPIPNYAIEEQALVSGLGGGFYDYQLQEVVPNNPSFINKIFKCTRNFFNKKIGSIYSGNGLRLNTATNLKNLRKDAEAAAPKFIENIRKKLSGISIRNIVFRIG